MKWAPTAVAATLIISALALTGCDSPAELEAKYLKRGEALFDQGDYTRARLEFMNAGRLAPTDAAPYYWIARINEATGSFHDAFLNYLQAVNRKPHFAPALLKLAQMYLAAEQLENVEKNLDTVLADDPNNYEAHALRASVLLRKNDFEGCEREARISNEANPNNTLAVAVLVGLYSAKQNLEQAAKVLDTAIATHPNDLSLLRLQVQLYRQFNLPERAAGSYDAILKMTPADVATLDEAAFYEAHAGMLDRAEATLRAGVMAAPKDHRMKEMLVTFLSEHRSLESAESTIRSYMAAEPETDGYYFMLADIYLKHNSADKAEALLNQVVDNRGIQTSGLNARVSLARLSFLRGNQALAEKLLSVVLASKASDPQALMTQAAIAFNEGHYQTVVVNMRSVLLQFPKSTTALRLLAEALLRQGHVDLAADTMGQLVEAEPGDLNSQLRLAQIFQLRGDSDQALKLLADLNQASPKNASILEVQARTAIAASNWQVADAAITALEALPPEKGAATFFRAQYQAGRGDADSAVGKLKTLIASDPNSEPASEGLGLLMEIESSRNHCDTTSTFLEGLKSDLPSINTALGECYWVLKRPVDAGRVFDLAVSKGNPAPRLILDRVDLYVATGKQAEAEALLRKQKEAQAGDVQVEIRLALIEAAEGKYADAVSIYQGLLSADESLDMAANNLADLIANHEYNDPAALETARSYADRFQSSSNPEFLDTVGWVYYRLGQFSKSVIYLERATSSKTANQEVHFHYGAALLKVGQKEQAKTELGRAIAGVTDALWLSDAKKMLESLS